MIFNDKLFLKLTSITKQIDEVTNKSAHTLIIFGDDHQRKGSVIVAYLLYSFSDIIDLFKNP